MVVVVVALRAVAVLGAVAAVAVAGAAKVMAEAGPVVQAIHRVVAVAMHLRVAARNNS